MADIFISYKKQDRPFAERLAGALQAAGKSVWWDDALSPAEAWDSMIEKEIAASRVVIVLWSPRSVQSDWVRSEAHYAQDHHKLVPVMVEPCSIPLAFMLRQAVDLSSGEFTRANPNYERLLGWIDAIGNSNQDGAAPAGADAPSPQLAAAAALPIKATTGESWLGPKRRSWAVAGAIATIALIALAAFLMRNSLGLGAPARADVYVDAFKVAPDPAFAAGFAQSFADEMSAQLSAGSAITPNDSDGQRHPDAFQMSGNIRTGDGKILMFAKVFAPGIAAPILSPRLDVPIEEKATAAKTLAVQAASLLRCIATASDSSHSAVTVLPEAALRPWAQFCQIGNGGGYDPGAARAALDGALKAYPQFAGGWANLAETRMQDFGNPTADKAKVKADINAAIDRALAIDNGNPKALMMRAIDRLGVLDALAAGKVTPLGHFDEFEKFADQANSSRPTDCGCEAIIYSQMLQSLGRMEAALPLLTKIIANDPANNSARFELVLALSSLGRDSDAAQLLSEARKDWPAARGLKSAALMLALERRDWPAAKAALAEMPVHPGAADQVAWLNALSAGDRARIDAAVAPSLRADPRSIGPVTASLMLLSGHDSEIAAMVRKSAQSAGLFTLNGMWLQSAKGVRAQPDFLALVKQLNLPAYWRRPGHRPDVCSSGKTEPLCTLI